MDNSTWVEGVVIELSLERWGQVDSQGAGHSRQEEQHVQRAQEGSKTQYQPLLLSLSYPERQPALYLWGLRAGHVLICPESKFSGQILLYQKIWLSFEDKEIILKCSEEAEW